MEAAAKKTGESFLHPKTITHLTDKVPSGLEPSCALLIDQTYLMGAFRSNIGFKIDLVKFLRYIQKVVGIPVYPYYYTGYDPKNGMDRQQEQFLTMIARLGFSLNIYPFSNNGGHTTLISRISIDAIKLSSTVSKIFITSGDQGFLPAVEEIRCTTSAQVTVIAFRQSVANLLLDITNNTLYLDDMVDEIASPTGRSTEFIRNF